MNIKTGEWTESAPLDGVVLYENSDGHRVATLTCESGFEVTVFSEQFGQASILSSTLTSLVTYAELGKLIEMIGVVRNGR